MRRPAGHHLSVAVVAMLVLAGCSQPQATGDQEVRGTAPRIAQSDTPLAPSSTASPVDAEQDAAGGVTESDAGEPVDDPEAEEDGPAPGTGQVATDDGEPEAATNEAASPRPNASATVERIQLVIAGDRAGDHGRDGPPHADLRQLTMAAAGDELELTATFAAELPLSAEEGEVMLTNIHLPEDGAGDDGYAFTVTFNADGWLVYLDTPEGLVQYPGDFVIGGDTFLLRVPWNAVGSPTRGTVRAQIEWSRDEGRSLVLNFNPSSTDPLDGQPHTFDRNP